MCIHVCIFVLHLLPVWVNPQKRTNYGRAERSAMFISHLTFISKEGTGGGEGGTVGVRKVASIRGNPSAQFLLLELPLAECSPHSGVAWYVEEALTLSLSLERCRGSLVEMESPPPHPQNEGRERDDKGSREEGRFHKSAHYKKCTVSC